MGGTDFLETNCLLVEAFFYFFQTAFVVFLLTSRYETKTTFAVLWLVQFLSMIPNHYFDLHQMFLWKMLTALLPAFLASCFLFYESIWMKLLVFMSRVILTIACELLMTFFFRFSGNSVEVLVTNPVYRAMGNIIISVFFAISSAFCIWWKRRQKLKLSSKTLLPFFFFILGQIMTSWAVTLGYYYSANMNLAIFGIIASIFLFASEVFILKTLIALEHNAHLEQKVQDMKAAYQIQLNDYQALKNRDKEISKAEHDYKNQLSTLLTLLQSGQSQEAARQLANQLKTRMIRQEHIYCANYIVNAVLTNKAQTCQQHNIRFDCDVLLPDETPIEPYHLCSICTNLLDNAIRAVSPLDADQSWIQFRARMDGKHPVIRVRNPYRDTINIHNTGYGQEILRDIAADYGGELVIQNKENIYTAILYL